MDLIAAGIVVFALLLASYSTRRTWIALGSMAVSIALLFGALVLYSAQYPGQIRPALTQIAEELPPGWDQPALAIASAIEQASTSLARAAKSRAERPAAAHEPLQAATTTNWFAATSEPQVQTPAKPEPAPEPAAAPDAPIEWQLEAPASADSETFQLGGTNVSSQPLEKVRAVLKPDTDTANVALTIHVDGQAGDGMVIPPGAKFNLVAPALSDAAAAELGGAILSLAYVQEGKRKKAIMYLTPPMLGKLANRK